MDAMTLASVANGVVATAATMSPSHTFFLLAPILAPAAVCVLWLVGWAIAQNRKGA